MTIPVFSSTGIFHYLVLQVYFSTLPKMKVNLLFENSSVFERLHAWDILLVCLQPLVIELLRIEAEFKTASCSSLMLN